MDGTTMHGGQKVGQRTASLVKLEFRTNIPAWNREELGEEGEREGRAVSEWNSPTGKSYPLSHPDLKTTCQGPILL
jgi:hypothetical protein